MKQGALIFDEQADRYDIRFDLEDYYGGLHCGETFYVMVGGRWKPTRIELAEDWYCLLYTSNKLDQRLVVLQQCFDQRGRLQQLGG